MTHENVTQPTPETIAAEIKAELHPTLEQRLAEAHALIAANEKRGKKHEVETSSGERKTVAQLHAEASDLLTSMKITEIENQRTLAALEAQNARPYFTDDGAKRWKVGAPETPLMDVDSLSKMHGVKGYAELTPEQKALGLTIRPSDVKAYNVRDYFGPTSLGKRANDLARKNPTMYRLLRKIAVEEQIIA